MSIPLPDRPLADRRAFLQIGGLAILGLAGAACADSSSSSSNSSSSSTSSATSNTSSQPVSSSVAASTEDQTATLPRSPSAALSASAFDGLGTCLLLPEATAGPFPLDQQFDRRDVTEGVPGHPMRLGLRVVDTACLPVPGAKVEIWHADSSGDYSAFVDGGGGKDDGPESTFLRGTQTADDSGVVEFLTVYPGWYRGRAVHIHLRVHFADATVLTSQMYFDDAYTAGVYASAPYSEFGLPDTTLGVDGLAGRPATTRPCYTPRQRTP